VTTRTTGFPKRRDTEVAVCGRNTAVSRPSGSGLTVRGIEDCGRSISFDTSAWDL
jgi:hypothetical protein